MPYSSPVISFYGSYSYEPGSLEQKTAQPFFSAETSIPLKENYKRRDEEKMYSTNKTEFDSNLFLSPSRQPGVFVQNSGEIMDFVNDAFMALTSKEFPKDIQVRVLDEKKFREAHQTSGGRWSQGIQGFSINPSKGRRFVFVKKDHLESVLLTLGHEIGHVLTPTLKSPHDEEAKAFAFSLAWIKIIKEKNIAGIGDSILPRPANNGLHNIAFDFIWQKLLQGNTASNVFKSLVKGEISAYGG